MRDKWESSPVCHPLCGPRRAWRWGLLWGPWMPTTSLPCRVLDATSAMSSQAHLALVEAPAKQPMETCLWSSLAITTTGWPITSNDNSQWKHVCDPAWQSRQQAGQLLAITTDNGNMFVTQPGNHDNRLANTSNENSQRKHVCDPVWQSRQQAGQY